MKNNLKTSLTQGTGYSRAQSDLAEALARGWLADESLSDPVVVHLILQILNKFG